MVEPRSTLLLHQRLDAITQTTFDLAIVGGGITGAGVAREAALRGYSVVLLEKDDLASGTSSRSSRLIHGGLRYLEHGKLGLVHESVSERWRLLHLAPHLVSPLPFVFPVYQGDRPGLATMKLGTWVYSMLAAFRTPGPRRSYNRERLLAAVPGLRGEGLLGAAGYFDCATNDARLTLENALDAQACGAVILPRTTVCGLNRSQGVTELAVTSPFLGQGVVRARTAVVAAGPWTDTALGTLRPETPGWLRPTKGVHIVFHARRFSVAQAVVMKTPGDHRVVFAVPWFNHTYVGTTDTDCPDPDRGLQATGDDVAYLLQTTNSYFPEARLGPQDVVSSWSGVRPLVAPHDEVAKADVDPSDISREERLKTYDDHLVVVAGGKLTTYRIMARHVVDVAARLLAQAGVDGRRHSGTKTRPLPGAQHDLAPVALGRTLQQDHPTLPATWVTYLAQRYGCRAPAIIALASARRELLELLPGCQTVRLAEVHFHVQQELATTIEDVLVRRSYVHYKTDDNGAGAAAVVADVLAEYEYIEESQKSATLTAFCEKFNLS